MKVEKEKFENAIRAMLKTKPIPKDKIKTAKQKPRRVIEPTQQR